MFKSEIKTLSRKGSNPLHIQVKENLQTGYNKEVYKHPRANPKEELISRDWTGKSEIRFLSMSKYNSTL